MQGLPVLHLLNGSARNELAAPHPECHLDLTWYSLAQQPLITGFRVDYPIVSNVALSIGRRQTADKHVIWTAQVNREAEISFIYAVFSCPSGAL
jgi:hypothetical protein